MKNLGIKNQSFEEIKHIDEKGNEYWYARELMHVLQYSNWQNFEKIIHKAMISCENSNISMIDHFTDVNKMVQKEFKTIRKRKQEKFEKNGKIIDEIQGEII